MIDKKPWLTALNKTPFSRGDYVRINDGRDGFTVGRVWGADSNGDGVSKMRVWVLISEAQQMTSYVEVYHCTHITKEEWFKQRLIEGVE